MTELVLLLCGAVIKTAFRLWIRNDPFADALTGDLTDMIRSRVSGKLDQRKIRSRFANLEEIVAEQLLSSLEVEFRDVDEGERSAAIIAATATFDQAHLTGQILMEKDLDPLSLQRYVQKFTGTTTSGLSQDAIGLYDRLLAQCCAYVIEIADKLPGFQTDAFGELLIRGRQILTLLEDVLGRLPTQPLDADNKNQIDIAYRQRLATVLDRLELYGLDFSSKWYALSIAYINLTLSNASITGAETLQEQLAECPRLLIEGRAGSGKTTILQWLAVRGARHDFEGRSRFLNDRIPFFLRLREYADGNLPTPEEFLAKIAPLLAPEARGWPRQQLKANRGFLLVDGIDELPEEQRPAVGSWLREMIDLFPNTRYVITTRPGAVHGDMLEELGFAVAHLEPMGPAQIRRFITQWHLAMLEWQTGEQERQRTASFERSLLNRIENNTFLRDLANTPLLAGLICALNLHLNAVLPRRKGEIYEKALIMFDQRDKARGITSEISVDLVTSNHLLGDLALWMVRNGVAEVPAESLQQVITRSTASLPNGPHDASRLCRHLVLRSGLLREPTAGNIDFVHKSFQEFLAAKALIALDNVGELVRNADEDQWEQVLILSAGQGNTRQTSDLLHELLAHPSTGKTLRRMRLLAVACIGEIRSASPEALTALETVIPKLMPPRSIVEAGTLSSAGEMIISPLAKLRRTNPDENAAIIRTSALVGGPKAMAVIASIAKRQEFAEGEYSQTYIEAGTIYGELMRAWEYFDPAAYASSVLRASGLDAVTMQDVRLIEYIREIPGISAVTVEPASQVMLDLSSLDDLPGLDDLSIIGAEFETLTGVLRNWPELRSFKILVADRLRDISELGNFTNLLELQISYCPDLHDYTPLSQLTSLESLWLQGQEDVDLSVLSELNSLEDLTISDGGTVDLRPLAEKVMSIYVFEDTNMVDLTGIEFRPDIRAPVGKI